MRKKNPALIKLGNNIRGIRESKGFSQEGFAHQVDLDRTYIGGVERGERNLAALNLIRIAAALDVEVGELFPAINELTSD